MINARILTDRLAELLRREQASMADFLVALADFDRRRAWLELGYSSLFYFLHRELGLSKGSAHYRKTAAELVQRFPEIVEPLRDGRLCITTIVPLSKVLTPANRGEMLPRFFHRSKKEAMEVAATVQPATAAPHRDVVTALPAATSPRAGLIEAAPRSPPAAHLVQPVEPTLSPTATGVTLPLQAPSRRDSAEPLSEAVSRLHVTVSRRFLEKMEAARVALSHLRPGASTEHVLEAGLDLVLQRHAKRKGLVEKPRGALRSARPETLTAAVKREVWTRDGGRCQWPLESGGICGATMRVEFDHKIPRAEGGPSTAGNVRLLCRVHNDLAARQRLGEAWMDQFTRRRSG
jgi:hypothetical protein